MKRFVEFFILIFIVSSVFLGGCNMIKSDREIANSTLEEILEIIQNKDKETLKTKFSKIAKESSNFEENIVQLFEYYNEEYLEYEDLGGLVVENEVDYGKQRKIIESTFEVSTNTYIYRIAIKEYVIDDFNSDNIGICSFYIIKQSEDINFDFAYWGDNKFTPGINIGIQNLGPT